ncbi:MAG TPA: hypothetical protein VI076_11165 [Actinopolymorphaceae bacterium]
MPVSTLVGLVPGGYPRAVMNTPADRLCLTLFAVTLVLADDELCC